MAKYPDFWTSVVFWLVNHATLLIWSDELNINNNKIGKILEL